MSFPRTRRRNAQYGYRTSNLTITSSALLPTEQRRRSKQRIYGKTKRLKKNKKFRSYYFDSSELMLRKRIPSTVHML